MDKVEFEEVKRNITRFDRYTRRYNLKFHGITEGAFETRFDCKRYILEVLQDSNIKLHPKGIEIAHRIGRKQQHRERPIMVSFFHFEEKDLILAKSQHIWNTTNIRIEEDFEEKVQTNRKRLIPILTAANKIIGSSGRKEFNANLKFDNLTVNGKVYTINNMDQLPEKLNPEKLATDTRGNITAFFSANSPLSNHHLAQQKIGNQVYNCNEQYFMQQKALTFGDRTTAQAILREKSPVLQKQMTRKYKLLDQTPWLNKCLEVMETGIRAKFTQNEHLREFLLQTGTTMLLEANPNDSFWGVGLSKNNPQLWKKNSTWANKATNHLGRLLSELRRDLR